MKRIISYLNLFILFVFSTTSISAQIEPPVLTFKDLHENWLFISKDTNFIKSPIDRWSSPYWVHVPLDIIHDEEFIYILESTATQSPYGGNGGCLVHKIDKKTGQNKWTFFNNIYSGNIFREFYPEYPFNGVLRILDNNNIEIIGYRDLDTFDFKTTKLLGFYGNPVKRILDNATGEVISICEGSDTSRSIYNFAGYNQHIRYISNADIVKFIYTDYEKNDSIYSSLEIYDIDDEKCEVDTPYIKRITYNSGQNGPIYKRPRPFIYQISEDTMIVLFFANDPNDLDHSPSKLTIVWLDTSDKNNIHVVKSKDITDVVYYPQSGFNGYINHDIRSNNIFIFQRAEDSPANQFYWCAWYDKDGNFKGKIDAFKKEFSNDYYLLVRPIGVIGGNAYFAAYNNKSCDILLVKPNTNKYTKVGQIKVENIQDIESIIFYDAEILSESEILISLRVNKYNQEGYITNFTYYYNFNLSDLGIKEGTNTEELNEEVLAISPNPARNMLKVTLENISSGIAKIIDLFGNTVSKQSYTNVNKYEFNVANIKSGMYILINKDNSGTEIKKKVMIIK